MQAEYARITKNALEAAFEYGKNNAAKEIGADAPPNPAHMLRQIPHLVVRFLRGCRVQTRRRRGNISNTGPLIKKSN